MIQELLPFAGSRKAALLLVGLAMLATACAKPPTEALMLAEKAVEEAGKAGAGEYAIDTYDNAKDALDKGRAAMEEKNYDGAAEWFAKAAKLAETAKNEVPAAREAAARAAEETLEGVGANLDHASELLEQLEGCKTIGQDPEATPEILAARLDEIREDVAASERDLEAGNPRAGLERASAADDQARELVAALEKALAAGTCP